MGENPEYEAETVYELITQLKDSDGDLFDSFDDAEEETKKEEGSERDPEEPTDKIDC